MQSGDRFRVLRGLGLGVGSLLLLSGAVLAAQSGRPADDGARPAASASANDASAAPSRSPEVDPFQGGEVEDASESPEAFAEDGARPSAEEHEGAQDDHDADSGDDEGGGEDHGAGHGGEDD